MHIETTKETFNFIFSNEFQIQSIDHEWGLEEIYHNGQGGQDGKAIYNHISNVWQYYLTDINA